MSSSKVIIAVLVSTTSKVLVKYFSGSISCEVVFGEATIIKQLMNFDDKVVLVKYF